MTKMDVKAAEGEFVRQAVEAAVRIGLLFTLTLWCFQIFRPFIVPFVWGLIIAVASYPAYGGMQRILGGRRGLASTLFALIAIVVVVVPIVVLSGSLLEGLRNVAQELRDGTLNIPAPPSGLTELPLVGESFTEVWRLASEDLDSAIEHLRPQIQAVGLWFLAATGDAVLGILKFIMAIIIAAVFLANGESVQAAWENIFSRLMDERGPRIMAISQATIGNVTQGILGVALIQALLAGLGFLVIGLPGAGLWAVVCLVLAVLQLPILILLPVALWYLFAAPSTLAGVAFLFWSIVVIVLNNVLQPLVMGRRSPVPVLVIFLGALGGFASDGIIGFFVGAVVLSMGYSLLVAWMRRDGSPAGLPPG
jgi:predicted PurR-regulated permease PerM